MYFESLDLFVAVEEDGIVTLRRVTWPYQPTAWSSCKKQTDVQHTEMKEYNGVNTDTKAKVLEQIIFPSYLFSCLFGTDV